MLPLHLKVSRQAIDVRAASVEAGVEAAPPVGTSNVMETWQSNPGYRLLIWPVVVNVVGFGKMIWAWAEGTTSDAAKANADRLKQP